MLTPHQLRSTVAEVTGVSEGMLASQVRTGNVAQARLLGMALGVWMGLPSDKVGAVFNRSGSAVRYAVKTAADLCETNAAFRGNWGKVRDALKQVERHDDAEAAEVKAAWNVAKGSLMAHCQAVMAGRR